jgi:hypothetical protein
LLFISFNSVAQNPCDYSVNVNDSIGTYSDYMLSEKNFGGSSNIFLHFVIDRWITNFDCSKHKKSKDFMKANCFDKILN